MKPSSFTQRSSSPSTWVVSGAWLICGSCAAPRKRRGSPALDVDAVVDEARPGRGQVLLHEAHHAEGARSDDLDVDVALVHVLHVPLRGLEKSSGDSPGLAAARRPPQRVRKRRIGRHHQHQVVAGRSGDDTCPWTSRTFTPLYMRLMVAWHVDAERRGCPVFERYCDEVAYPPDPFDSTPFDQPRIPAAPSRNSPFGPPPVAREYSPGMAILAARTRPIRPSNEKPPFRELGFIFDS